MFDSEVEVKSGDFDGDQRQNRRLEAGGWGRCQEGKGAVEAVGAKQCGRAVPTSESG